jgi:PAS domain S-box-containing protein
MAEKPTYKELENRILKLERSELECKLAERAFREKSKTLSSILESNPHGIAMIDSKDHYLYINPYFTKITGYTLEEIPTKKDWLNKVYPDPEYRKKITATWEKDTQELGMGKSREFQIICKNGQSKCIEFRSTFLTNQTISVLTDITQRCKAKKELRESEERLKAIFQANPDPVAVYDINKYPLFLNPAFTEVFGWCLTEMQNKDNPFVPKDQTIPTQRMVKESYESGNPVRFETKRLSKDGRKLNILLSAAGIKNIHGINNGFVINFKDITEQKRIEAHLRQSQKMEAIGTLAGGIAHDFNNILSGIFGYAQLTEMSLNDPDKARKQIKQVVKGAQRASDLVQQILTFSRQTEYKKYPIKLSLIVKEAIKFLRSSIPATIEIQEKILSGSTISADPTQAHQVIMNLCTNAYQAMRETGGTLTVVLDDMEIKCQEPSTTNPYIPGNFIKLEIRDTGQGMDNETQAKMFDPYFTTKKPDEGTGLGLAVVAGIVKKHHGFIRADSEPNRGSVFQVFWPATQKNSADCLPESKKARSLNGSEHIMLVDDEPDILDSLKGILEKQGYQVRIFRDAISAFQAFVKDPGFFDLIITDMVMPRMTGNELSVKVLNIRKSMPIILCTGYNENFTQNMADKIGISKYIQKPLTGPALSALIRETLDEQMIATQKQLG